MNMSALQTPTMAIPVRTQAARPRILFLACYFPPVQSSGCIRTWNLAKYLSRMNWDVTIVTPEPSHWRHIDEPHIVSADLKQLGIRRLLTGHRWRCLAPDALNVSTHGLAWVTGGACRKMARTLGVDPGIGWVDEAEKTCAGLTPNDVDVILASGPPFAGFVLAQRLADRLCCPYVLDYRDPWVLQGRAGGCPVYNKTEKELVVQAAAVTAISPSLFGEGRHFGEKFHVVTNGFDPDEMAPIRPRSFDHRAIVYAGIFHFPNRVITPIMQALALLKRSGGPDAGWRFHYYGPQNEHVAAEAQRFGVLDRVELHGLVPRAEALAAIRGAALTIVITSVLEEIADAGKGIVTGKVFDALGLGAPILIVGPRGSDLDLIVETTGLAQIIPAGHLNGIALCIKRAISGRTVPSKNPEAYAWPNLIQAMHRILREATHTSQWGSPATACHQRSMAKDV